MDIMLLTYFWLKLLTEGGEYSPKYVERNL